MSVPIPSTTRRDPAPRGPTGLQPFPHLTAPAAPHPIPAQGLLQPPGAGDGGDTLGDGGHLLVPPPPPNAASALRQGPPRSRGAEQHPDAVRAPAHLRKIRGARHPPETPGVGSLGGVIALRVLAAPHLALPQTYIGSILVSVNPYQLYNIYGTEQVMQYEGRALGENPP